MDIRIVCEYIIRVGVILLFKEFTVNCEIQSFGIAPSNTEVEIGLTTTLKCQVRNQAGTVQWSKNGELLGFDPDIPGYPRYQILNNTDLGIYDLKIINASLEDEAEFECQVGPAAGHEAIVRKAHLTILFQPTSIEISGRENGSLIQVEVSKHISLECVVKGGKPAPVVVWYRNSYKLSNEQARTSVSDESNGKKTVKSTLGITPNNDDDKAVFFCEAKATFKPKKLKTYITLDVLYPPGKPIIEGYRTNDKIKAGETVTMKCFARGGNPLARLVWTKNNDTSILDHSYTTSDWEAVNEITFQATASDDGAIYKCTASSVMTREPFEKTVTLQVLYAPASISIKAPKEAKPGDVITATCLTEPSNPAADVTWVIDGTPVVSSTEVKMNAKGGWITSSQINVNVTQLDRVSKMFTCYAVNQQLGETITKSSSVSILYAPDPPSIFGYVEGTAIHAGKLQRLTCISHGGNPLPELKWFKGSKELTSSEASTTGTIVSKELAIITTADDNGAQYKCKSTSKALSEPLTATINLTVYFPPKLPTIKVKPKKIEAGMEIQLSCECSSSNPAANISWWRSGKKRDVELEPTRVKVTDASENQGFSSKAILNINVTAEDDGTKYICQATNEAIEQRSHDAVILNVLYKPIFKLSDKALFEVKENYSTTINVSAKGNPSDIKYKCIKNDMNKWEGSVYNISEAERNQSGPYLCTAKNEVGESSITVIIKVLYAMKIIKKASKKVVIAEPYTNVKLQCTAHGDPKPKDSITWSYGASNMQERTETLSDANGKSSLIIQNVTREISGPFTCKANNGIGSADSWDIILLVKHAPVIKDLNTYKTVFSDRETSAELQCKAEGVPEVLFSWSVEGVVVSKGASRFKNEITNVDHFVWKSVLTIENVTVKDFAEYKCIARNGLGYDTAEISLLPDSKPDPPAVVKVTNITKDAFLVVWVPGFNGGHNVSHRIRYKSKLDPAANYQDAHPPDTNSSWIQGLKSDTKYELAMIAINIKGASLYTTDKIKVLTLSPSNPGFKLKNDGPSLNDTLIELLVSTIGTVFFLLLVFNIILLALYYRKKRPKIRRKYSDDVPSLSGSSTSSKMESEETTFSSYTSETKYSGETSPSSSPYSSSSVHKSASYGSSDGAESEEYSLEYSSNRYKAYSSSNFI